MGLEMHMTFFLNFSEFSFFSLAELHTYIPVNGLKYHGEGCCWQYLFNKSRVFNMYRKMKISVLSTTLSVIGPKMAFLIFFHQQITFHNCKATLIFLDNSPFLGT